MERDEVGPLGEDFQGDQLDAEVVRLLGGDERIVGHHHHVERERPPHDLAPDAAEAHHAERLAPQLGSPQALLAPPARLHLGVGQRDGARRGEHEREHVLRDADAVRAGRIEHEDAAVAGGLDVDVVDPCAGTRHDPEARSGSDQLGRDRRGAADYEGIGVGEVGAQLGRRATATGVDGPPLGFEQGDGSRGQRIRNHDFHELERLRPNVQ